MKDDSIEQKNQLIVSQDGKGQKELEESETKNLKDSEYTQKLKQAQIKEIEKYIEEIKLDLIQQEHKLYHSKNQQSFFKQQIVEQGRKIESVINQKRELKEVQNQYKWKINNCYNQIEIIAKELSKVDECKGFLTFQTLENNQLEINEEIERNKQIKEFMNKINDRTKMETYTIDMNLRQLYIQFEQQQNFKNEQNKLVQLLKDEDIDKKKYQEVYENIIRNIQKHLRQISRPSTIDSQFNGHILMEWQYMIQEALQVRHKIRVENSNYFQQMKKIQQNNKNIEIQVKICESRQQALKQKILQTQRKIEHQNQQMKITQEIITQLEISEQTLSSKQHQIKSELSTIENELKDLSYHSLTYNQSQKQIKQYQKNNLTICSNINSVKYKLNRNRQKINCSKNIILKYQKKIDTYLKGLNQSEEELRSYTESQSKLNVQLKQIEMNFSDLLIQEQQIQAKITEKWQNFQQLLQNQTQQPQQYQQIDDQNHINELEAINRDNIQLLSMEEYMQIQSNLINFIDDLLHFTQEHINIEENNKRLQHDSQTLLQVLDHKFEQIQILYQDMNHCKSKQEDIVQIDQCQSRIEFELKYCFSYISDTEQQKILKQEQCSEIIDEIENLRQTRYDMENSLNHIRFQEESILQYRKHLEYQLTLQNQIYNMLIEEEKVSDKMEIQRLGDSSSQFQKS